jgi:hypothetical protein
MTSIINARRWPLRFLEAPSIFLAGPTYRNGSGRSWRAEAIELIRSHKFDGHILVPEDPDWGLKDFVWLEQVKWEWEALEVADCVLFWIPRDLTMVDGQPILPGFTTNVEFGYMVALEPSKVVAGAPLEAPKIGYLRALAIRHGIQWHSRLESLVHDAVGIARASYVAPS